MVSVVAQSRLQGLVTFSRREDSFSTGLQSLSLPRTILLSQELPITFSELFQDFKEFLGSSRTSSGYSRDIIRIFSGFFQDSSKTFSRLAKIFQYYRQTLELAMFFKNTTSLYLKQQGGGLAWCLKFFCA